jgi:Zn-dependent metalloprotease
MKKILVFTISFVLSVICLAQNQKQKTIISKADNGIILSVEFSETDSIFIIPNSAEVFFKSYLKISSKDQFKKVPHISKSKDFIHEHFDQYYNDVKVDGAGYNFHYKDGKMYFANGHYVKINDLITTPLLTPEEAKISFSKYKNITADSITNFISELIIKEISSIEENVTILTPKLVYRIYLFSNHKNNNEIGFVDAQTGKVLLTEPSIIDYAATGTFATLYSGSRQGATQHYGGSFHLADSSRGAIIHTMNMNGSTDPGFSIELSDNDNTWTAAEHSASENDMGLDIHWALQHIYDHLNNSYGYNSFNDNGFAINAFIHYGFSNDQKDNAGWNPTLDILVFGDGAVKFRPVASLDAVAHEYGHGITDFQIGWGGSGNPVAFNEGMSDIWAAILEYRIRPNSIWQIGEQIDLSYGCLRNIQNTNDVGARQKMADTYLSTQYNNDSNPYVRGGVLSHWFYLLVNGGSGTNGVGNPYNVYGVGINTAEDLIVEAVFNNYLDNTTTYPEIHTAMVNAANTLYGGQSDLLVNQVENAWYAVGLGAQPTQMIISGPTLLCSSGGVYSISNVPAGYNINWSSSDYITRVSPQNSNPCTFSGSGGSGWITATISLNNESVTLPHYIVWGGPPSTTSISGPSTTPPYDTKSYYAYADHTEGTSFNWWASPSSYLIWPYNDMANVYFTGTGYYMVYAQAYNSCGQNTPLGKMVNVGYFRGMIINPNPASDIVNVTIDDSPTLVTPNSVEISSVSINTTTSIETKPAVYNITVINSMGVPVYSTKSYDKSFTIPVRNLINGNYYITVNDGTKIFSKQLIVKHN